ncbi:MAG: 3-deoxy-7-phosphoheptulonate synthase [Candidatus Njordarchaeales archaeon]
MQAEGLVVIGGPCVIESPEQVDKIVPEIAKEITFFRGGVFRAGTYPPKKIGWNFELLKYYHQRCEEYGKTNIVDVLDYRDIDRIEPYLGAFQVGMRAAQNYALLDELSKQEKPVFLKRGAWQTVDEWLGSLEYLVRRGKRNVFLIERGIVGLDNHTRYSLCLSSIPAVKEICNVSIIVDACHGTGRRDIVPAMTFAGVAAGADGILLETHYDPENAMGADAVQTIGLDTFHRTVSKAREIYKLLRDK